jgi:hypothetical protein
MITSKRRSFLESLLSFALLAAWSEGSLKRALDSSIEEQCRQLIYAYPYAAEPLYKAKPNATNGSQVARASRTSSRRKEA